MRRSLRRAWLPVVAAGGLLAGCEHNQATHYPPDPLLLSKRPVESRGDTRPAATVARREPAAPECLVAAATPQAGDRATVPTSLRPGRDDDR
ncbi:MAG TPA: hypothetical protein VFW33_01385 [Gemmataceae bacterium]|nr:hypothetical protein [Gemmataceae bacterium]